MSKYLLLCAAIIIHGGGGGVLGKPLQSDGTASHIVIVTPQAQLHLEQLPATYIHHLSPLARYAGPISGLSGTHEETIVYVPAGVPLNNYAAVIGRSTAAASLAAEGEPTKQLLTYDAIGNRQFGNVTQIQNLEQIQQIATQWGTQLSEAAGTIGSAFFPPTSQSQQPPPALPQPEQQPQLISTEARHYYAIAPSVPHVLDLVRGPVFVGPVSSIRARSIQELAAPDAAPLQLDSKAELPLPLAEAAKIETNLPVKSEPKAEQQALKVTEPEQKTDFGRFLEANALKEGEKPLKLQEEQKLESSSMLQRDDLKINSGIDELKLNGESQPLIGAATARPELNAGDTPQLRSVVPAVGVVGGDVVAVDGSGVLRVVDVPVPYSSVIGGSVVGNEVPQSKLLAGPVIV